MLSSQRFHDLLNRARTGDPSALKTLLTMSRPSLHAYAARKLPAKLKPHYSPDDIVQETHVEVFRRIERFQPRSPDSFEKWMYTIALNRIRDALRRQRAAKRGGQAQALSARRIEDSSLALLDLLAGPGHRPSQSVARIEAVDAVRSAIAALPENYRHAVWSVHIQGLCVRDVAANMGRTERAVHALVRRGMKKMRDRLASASTFLSTD